MNHSRNDDNNKNQNSNHDSKHMWWMMAGCVLLPLLLFLFSGRGGSGGSGWPWIIFVILCVGMHVGMMFGHKKKQNNDQEVSKTQNPDDEKHEHV